jgi:hypothetical protein
LKNWFFFLFFFFIWNNTVFVRGRSVLPIVSLWELSLGKGPNKKSKCLIKSIAELNKAALLPFCSCRNLENWGFSIEVLWRECPFILAAATMPYPKGNAGCLSFSWAQGETKVSLHKRGNPESWSFQSSLECVNPTMWCRSCPQRELWYRAVVLPGSKQRWQVCCLRNTSLENGIWESSLHKASLDHPGGRPRMYKGTQWGAGTDLVRLQFFRLVRTQVQIQAHPRRQNGTLNTSQRPLVTAFWGEAVSLRFREQGRSTVLCKSV